MKGFLCLLAGVLFVSCVSAGLYGKNSNVVQLTTESFAKEVFGSNDVWIVEFYAPWCGHCKNLAPQYEAAATKLKGLVKVGAVDCDVEANKQLAQHYQVQGFPTLKIFPGEFSENPYQKGAPFKAGIDYQGQRTADAIVQAVMNHLKYFGEQITDANIDEFTAKEGNKVLLLSEKKKTTGLYKALSGHFNGRMSFGQGTPSLGEKFGVEKYPALLVINEEGVTPYQGKLSPVELVKFLEPFAGKKQWEQQQQQQQQQQQKQQQPETYEPIVYHLTSQEDFDNRCPGGICVIAFLNPDHSDHENYLSILQTMSEEYVKYFRIMWLDGLKYSQFSKEFLNSVEDLPRIVVFSKGKKLYTPFLGAFSEGSVKNFLGKVLHGKKRSFPLDNIPAFA